MHISPNPGIGSHPGGGSVTFTFGVSVSGGSGSYSISWSTGDTGGSTTFTEHVAADDEQDGFIGVSVVDLSTGATGSDTAEWIAHGF